MPIKPCENNACIIVFATCITFSKNQPTISCNIGVIEENVIFFCSYKITSSACITFLKYQKQFISFFE